MIATDRSPIKKKSFSSVRPFKSIISFQSEFQQLAALGSCLFLRDVFLALQTSKKKWSGMDIIENKVNGH